MILLDTSAILELVPGTEKGRKISLLIENEAVAIASVSVNELLVNSREKNKMIIQEFLNSAHILPFDADAAYKSVDIEESLRKKGKPIGKLDIFIASVCLIHNLAIITLDKDFENIEELKVINPLNS